MAKPKRQSKLRPSDYGSELARELTQKVYLEFSNNSDVLDALQNAISSLELDCDGVSADIDAASASK